MTDEVRSIKMLEAAAVHRHRYCMNRNRWDFLCCKGAVILAKQIRLGMPLSLNSLLPEFDAL